MTLRIEAIVQEEQEARGPPTKSRVRDELKVQWAEEGTGRIPFCGWKVVACSSSEKKSMRIRTAARENMLEEN